MTSNEGVPIFLVMGSTGEYDDYHEWVVCAYRDHESAEKHAILANEDAKRFVTERGDEMSTRHKSAYDENMHIDYTGTEYFIEQTALHTFFRS